MPYLLRQTTEKLLDIMNKLPEHDAFLVEFDNQSGIGTTVTVTVDVIYRDLPGRFSVEVEGPESW